jgi:predicted glycoside hydrolase/deacetylase ChbG (UPF0249 family)
VVLLVPSYNEEQVIRTDLPVFLAAVGKKLPDAKVLVVENGSTDNSKKLLESLKKSHKNLLLKYMPIAGFGPAVKAGLEAAAAMSDKVVLLNADWLELDFCIKSAELLDEYDIVVGSKSIAGSHDERPFFRKISSELLNTTLRVFFGFHGSDSHGIKSFRSSALLMLLPHLEPTEIIESELLLRSDKFGLKKIDSPVGLAEIRPPRDAVLKRYIWVAKELFRLKIRLARHTLPVSQAALHIDDIGLNKEMQKCFSDLGSRIVGGSVLVTGEYLDDALKAFQKLNKPIWLHLNLVEGKSLTGYIRGLTDRDGVFKGRKYTIFNALLRRIDSEGVVSELTAQYNKLANMKVDIYGIDSHQHMHILSPIAEIVVQFAATNRLQIRSYGNITNQTWFARTVCAAFKTFSLLSTIVNHGTFRRNKVLSDRSRLLLMPTWNSITCKVRPEVVIVIHPHTEYDRGESKKIWQTTKKQ